MKKEYSAGGVVFNNKGQVLLVKSSDKKSWGFPKGKINSDETPEQAALREVKEEGGVEAKIISKIGESKYSYTLFFIKISKTVVYYLMDYLSGDPKDHDWEIEEVDWFSPEEAFQILTFPASKNILQQALETKEQDER